MLEETHESTLESKEIKPVSLKGNQPWIYSLEGLKLKLQYFGHLMQRAGLLPQWLSGKDSACSTRAAGDMGSITGLDDPLEKGMATHSSSLVGEPMEQRSLAGYSPWGHRVGHKWSDFAHTHNAKQLTHWQRPSCWERWKEEEEGDRGWDGWMASRIQWAWTWANSGRWWETGKPSVLQFMRSRRVLGDWTRGREAGSFKAGH